MKIGERVGENSNEINNAQYRAATEDTRGKAEVKKLSTINTLTVERQGACCALHCRAACKSSIANELEHTHGSHLVETVAYLIHDPRG